jgi:HKD family nuclease
MPQITILRPTDQPTNKVRLINELKLHLACNDFSDFRIVVAFAKLGPLQRLSKAIEQWVSAGKTVRGVMGIDQNGTSKQALEYALSHFTETYVAHIGTSFSSPTFHPKMYWFSGSSKAVAYIGSNNLTVGGTETNLETYIKLILSLPGDNQTLVDLNACWTDALQVSTKLTPGLLAQLAGAGFLLDESQKSGTGSGSSAKAQSQQAFSGQFPSIHVVPPSPIPAPIKVLLPKKPKTAPVSLPMPVIGAQGLVIQIVPHHNGEVFLSKLAIDQNPGFFGWPFSGQTVPKKPSNRPYPQRIPDPIVDLKLYDATGLLKIQHDPFNLNTVYYEPKSEIRITVPQDIVRNTPPLSAMVMRDISATGTHDYEIEIWVPGSQQYTTYLGICNQTMPSGGAASPRKFGWI